MTIYRLKSLYPLLVTLVILVGCVPKTKTDKGMPSSPPAGSSVPMAVESKAVQRPRPTTIEAAISAAARGPVGAGTGKMMDEQERTMRTALEKSKTAMAQRQRNLLTVRLQGDAAFATNSVALGQDLYAEVERIVIVLDKYPRTVVRVEAHTDSQGSEAYNLDLSRRRAESVKNLMQQLGISSSRIEAAGLGESLPLASNEDAAGRTMNRRLEIKIAPSL